MTLITRSVRSYRTGPQRLAVYGSLAPGRPNHYLLAPLGGRWCAGTVRGRLVRKGWGARMGFPGIVLDPLAGDVPVHMLETPRLCRHWRQLDRFEGRGYRRVQTCVTVKGRAFMAWIYEVNGPRPATLL
ncbi:MAG: gamma-glutamylcyclotransferase [Notoacmeibacter sp.]|nr:gamma-glutamylcyclotransferase [Notoacmeibacter sp.]MCC0032626.1 gamma-glutamylcyclotransferase [Brucellaceae bacterium]